MITYMGLISMKTPFTIKIDNYAIINLIITIICTCTCTYN